MKPRISSSISLDTPLRKEIRTIALYFDSFGAGGVQRCLRLLASIFQSLGKKVVYVSETPAPEEEKILFPADVEFSSIRRDGNEVLSSNERRSRWHAAIERFSVDAVYYAAYHVPQLDEDTQSIHAAGVQVVVHFHTVFSARLALQGPTEFSKRLEGWRRADAFIVLSRTDAAFFSEMGIRCWVIPNPPPYPEPRVTEPRSLSGKARIVWCGQIRNIPKRPSEAVRILAEVRKTIPSATLAVIGGVTASPVTHAAKEAMVRAARELGCEAAIEWVGHHVDVSPFLDTGDVFISTSAWEGAPFTFMEAYAHGLPIVAYRLPNVESAQNHIAARQAPQRDAKAAAAEIVALLSDPAAYREASRAALGVFSEFAAVDQRKEWRAVFDSLAAEPLLKNTHPSPPGSFALVLETLIGHTCFWENRMQEELRNCRKREKSERGRADALAKRNAALERSLSVRLGFLLTVIPRKIFEAIHHIAAQ